MTSMTVPEPVMSLAVAPKSREASANFSKALNRFTKEDPTFQVCSPLTMMQRRGMLLCISQWAALQEHNRCNATCSWQRNLSPAGNRQVWS